MERSMRVLFTGCPAYGHVNPLLPLAREARRAGHDVAVATGAELVPQIESCGFDAWLVGPSHAESDASLRAAYPDLETLAPQERMQVGLPIMFVEAAAKRAVDLVPRAQKWKPDIVVHEMTELAGALVAARTGARHVVHGVGPVPSSDRWEASFAPGFARLCRSWQVPELADSIRLATYLDTWPPSLCADGEPVWQRIQPLRPATGEPTAGEQLPKALAALPHPQTICLTLGTVFYEAPGVLDTAIAGLRELPLNLVVITGPGTDPARLGPQPPHVLVQPYVPYSLLLPCCRVVVCHGGTGIMLGALAHGLPALMLPQAADQFMNAAAAHAAGAALVLTPDEFSADAVAAAAQRLITDPGFAVAAGALRTEIDAMPSTADVLAVLTAQASA